MVVDGALKSTLGLFLHRIAALNLAFLLSKPGDSFCLLLFFMTFITIVRSSTLIITLNLIQFYLLEVIVCSYVHLSQSSTVVDILFLSTLCSYGTLYYYLSSMIQTQNLSAIPCFTIYVSVSSYFCTLLLCLVLCCGWCMQFCNCFFMLFFFFSVG